MATKTKYQYKIEKLIPTTSGIRAQCAFKRETDTKEIRREWVKGSDSDDLINRIEAKSKNRIDTYEANKDLTDNLSDKLDKWQTVMKEDKVTAK